MVPSIALELQTIKLNIRYFYSKLYDQTVLFQTIKSCKDNTVKWFQVLLLNSKQFDKTSGIFTHD